MKCIHCSSEIPADSVFCMECGAPVAPRPAPVVPPAPVPSPVPSPAPTYVAPSAGKPRRAKKWLPFAILGGVAIVVVVVLLIVLLGGKTMPQEALTNLIEKGNFTLELRAMGNTAEIQVDIDWDKEDLTIYAESDGEFVFAIYDGYYIYEYYNYYYDYYYYDVQDISDEIEIFFDNYASVNQIDWDDLADLLEDTTGEDASDYVDLDQMADCLETFLNKLENKSWLKKNAGYSTKKQDGVTLHIYEPDLNKLASAVLNIFAPCFEDEDLYEYAMEFLDDYEAALEDINITLTLGVRKDYLVSAELKVSGVKIKASIDKIGSTRIDLDELEEILEDAMY